MPERDPKLFRSITKVLGQLFCVSSFVFFNHKTVVASDFFSQKNYSALEGSRLLDKKIFYHAQKFLERSLDDCADDSRATLARYDVAICSIKLNRKYGQWQLIDFSKNYPESPKAKYAQYTLGNLAMKRQAFAEAIEYYESIVVQKLDPLTQASLKNSLAYAYLSERNFEKALPIFLEIASEDNPQKCDACYYAGFIEFKQEHYSEALKLLQQACGNLKYKDEVPYMIAQIFYREKKFDELITYVEELIKQSVATKSDAKNFVDIKLLLAEAYFAKLQYKLAAPLYEEYVTHLPREGSPIVNYRLAYSLYVSKNFDGALRFFKKIDREDSMLGQLACYYTGVIYLIKKEYQMALAPLAIARDRDFARDIVEESALKYAQASFAACDYDATIQACLDFKKRFANTKYALEVDEMLGLAYSHTRDYSAAIAYMESLAKIPTQLAASYQKVTLAKAVELYHASDLSGAALVLNKSLVHAMDKKVAALAKFLRAKIYVQLSEIDKGMKEYAELISSTDDAEILGDGMYERGYVFFNKRDYKSAAESFSRASGMGSLSAAKKKDAALRLADCAYAMKNYEAALDAYTKLEHYKPAHCYYYEGLILPNLGKSELAHVAFEKVIRNYGDTIFCEKSLFEDAMLYFLDEDYSRAINAFSTFIKARPASELQPRALLYRAIAFSNLKEYEEAIQDCIILLQDYSDTRYAQDARPELQKALMALGRSDEFDKYLGIYEQKNAKEAALEASSFEMCKSLYYQQQHAQAIERFNSFLKNFSNSKIVPEARYLLAETYYAVQRYGEAEGYYDLVLQDDAGGAFHNKILLRLATVCQKDDRYNEALVFYRKLRDLAKTEKERNISLEGIASCSFRLKQYAETKRTAELYAKEQKGINTKSLCEINLMLAKIAIEEGRREDAESLLITLYKNNYGEQAAEALYILAHLLFEGKKYKESLEKLFELNKSFPQHKVWLERASLLIVDNYLAMGELLQARATLSNLAKTSSDANIFVEVQSRLKKIAELDSIGGNSTVYEDKRFDPGEERYKVL